MRKNEDGSYESDFISSLGKYLLNLGWTFEPPQDSTEAGRFSKDGYAPITIFVSGQVRVEETGALLASDASRRTDALLVPLVQRSEVQR